MKNKSNTTYIALTPKPNNPISRSQRSLPECTAIHSSSAYHALHCQSGLPHASLRRRLSYKSFCLLKGMRKSEHFFHIFSQTFFVLNLCLLNSLFYLISVMLVTVSSGNDLDSFLLSFIRLIVGSRCLCVYSLFKFAFKELVAGAGGRGVE